MRFTVPDTFDLVWLAERLREEHGYLGPDEQTFYPRTVLDGTELTVAARTSTGTEIDERSRDSIQAIIDAHDGSPPADIAADRQRTEDAQAIIEANRNKARQVVAGEAVSFTPQERDRILSALVELL